VLGDGAGAGTTVRVGAEVGTEGEGRGEEEGNATGLIELGSGCRRWMAL